MDATISVVCYKSKTLSNGEHPLMLRISKDGKKKYQSLGISVNPKFWDFQKNKPKPKCPNLEYLQKIILDKKLELQKKMLEIKSDQKEYWLSGNFWLVSFKISYLCLPLFYETRTTPSCHPSGCAYRQL